MLLQVSSLESGFQKNNWAVPLCCSAAVHYTDNYPNQGMAQNGVPLEQISLGG